MGRLYQLFALFSVLCVFNYVRTECRGLRYNKALLAAIFTTLFFVTIGYKQLSIPHFTYLFIGVIGIPSIIYGVMYDPNILLIIAAIYIPFNLLLPADFGEFQKAFNGTNVVLIALFIGFMLGKKKSSIINLPKSNIIIKIAILYALLSIISFIRGSLFHGVDYLLAFLFPLKRWLTPMILMLFFYKMLRDRDMIKIIYAIFMIIVIANIFYGVLEWVDLGFGTYTEFKRRLGGMNGAPNLYGAFLVYYSCLIIAPFLTSFRKTSAKFLIFPIMLGLRILIPTNSRGAWISLPPALLTVSFFKNKILFLGAILATVMAVLFFPILIPGTVKMRIEGATSMEDPSGIYADQDLNPIGYLSASKSVSMRTRAILLSGGLKMMRLNPWFGQGWGTFPYLIGNYTEGGVRGTSHNMVLRLLCEMGYITVVVLGIFLILMFRCGFYFFRREKDLMLKGMALGYMASIPAIIVCNFTGNRFDSVDLIVIFWILSACVLRLKDIIHHERALELR
jgi:O-antigen ligase/polysaccharide polymerase Wzy-like membrane protein